MAEYAKTYVFPTADRESYSDASSWAHLTIDSPGTQAALSCDVTRCNASSTAEYYPDGGADKASGAMQGIQIATGESPNFPAFYLRAVE